MKYKHACSEVFDKNGVGYKTIIVNNQEWLAENLNTDEFLNGDKISELKPAYVNCWEIDKANAHGKDEWYFSHLERKPAFSHLNSDANFAMTYGKLYNFWAIMDGRGIGIEGFRLPKIEDFLKLKAFLGEEPGRKLKSKNEVGDPHHTNWSSASGTKKGTDAVHFNGLPSGNGVVFHDQIHGMAYDAWNKYAIYWADNSEFVTNQDNPQLDPNVACLFYGEDDFFVGKFSEMPGWMGAKYSYALSVRLVRDLQ
jgi:uncharacterized protein (TIGR02145 family)